MKLRIIKQKQFDGKEYFTVQKRDIFFVWWNIMIGLDSEKEAREFIDYYMGSQIISKEIVK